MSHSITRWALVIAASSSGLVTSCGADPGTRPEDMSAADHRKAAAADDTEAKEHQGKYNAKSRRSGAADAGGDTFSFPMSSYNPTTHHLADADKFRRQAHAHRQAAATLENWEEQECGEFPAATRSACPLIGNVASVQDVDKGVRITFAQSANIEAVIAHVKCHRAFAAVHGFEGMESCPMYVKAVNVDADETAHTVTFTVDDPDLVENLRARAAAHVVP